MTYRIDVEQSTGGVNHTVEKRIFKVGEIKNLWVSKNCYTHIGTYPNCVLCREMVIAPSGLTIPLYISVSSSNSTDVVDVVLKRLNSIINDNEDWVGIKLSLPELPLGNYQNIEIRKIE